MDIYRAISDFKPPNVEGSQNILSFAKGDLFEIYECHKTSEDWWGARALKDNIVGYVPSRYMEYEERKIGKLLPEDYDSQKEKSIKRLSDMQNQESFRPPGEVIPQTPVPDYDTGSPADKSAFVFAKKFERVLSHIRDIEEMYPDLQEPEPDYNEDEPDFPPPPAIIKQRTESGSEVDESLLIQPKKLHNPCLESSQRMALHKELLHNYKRGIDVLEKPELSKVLQKRRDTQRKMEWEEQKKQSTKRTSFELKLEEQANKLKVNDEMKPIKEDDREKPEFQKVLDRIKQKSNGEVK